MDDIEARRTDREGSGIAWTREIAGTRYALNLATARMTGKFEASVRALLAYPDSQILVLTEEVAKKYIDRGVKPSQIRMPLGDGTLGIPASEIERS